MTQLAVKCGCGRTMTPNGRSGRGAFRCGCGARVQIIEQSSSARRCTYADCRTLATTKEPLRFCSDHEEPAALLLARTAAVAELIQLREDGKLSQRSWSRKYRFDFSPPPAGTDHAPLVYFARRERLIKIGTTTQLVKRMKAIPARALATEPGDIVRERQLHQQFDHLLAAGREWFHPGAELVLYINGLREVAGVPPIKR